MIGKLISRLMGHVPRPTRTWKLRPGDLAPAFEARDQHGELVRSADLLGKRYVLWFYPKAATPG